MKKKLKLTLLIFILISSRNFCQDCTECKQRNIIVYDNTILVPRPEGTDSLLSKLLPKWWGLFFAAAGENSGFHNDPTKDCLRKYDAALFTEPDSMNTILKFGTEYTNTVPPGPLGGFAQYIIYGALSGGNGSYTLAVYFETAQSRETIKTVTINFTDNDDPISIGKNAITQLGPLYKTIMDFEKKKRDQGDPYAVNPTIETIPDKGVIKINESTNVTFKLTDCDGVLLKNRAITLTTSLGRFDPATVTTDNEGKASSIFKAGNTQGIASVKADYPYKRAYDLSGISISEDGNAIIQIEKQPYWNVTGNYYYSFNWTHDISGKYPGGSTEVMHEDIRTIKSHRFKALLDVKTYMSGVYYTDTKPVAFSTTGNYSDGASSISTNTYPGVGYSRTNNFSYCEGTPNPNDIKARMNLNFGLSSREFNFNVPASMNGGGQRQFISVQTGSEGTNSTDLTDCEGAENYSSIDFHGKKGGEDTTYTVTENEVRPDGTNISKTTTIHRFFRESGGTYQMQYNETSQEQESSISEYTNDKKVSDCTIAFTAVIDSHISTGVQADNLILPDDYLFPNHPNPFNPVTRINYSISKPGNVKLIIYDLLGRKIKSLVNSFQVQGDYSVNFDGGQLNSGIYFYVLKTNNYTAARKMLLLK